MRAGPPARPAAVAAGGLALPGQDAQAERVHHEHRAVRHALVRREPLDHGTEEPEGDRAGRAVPGGGVPAALALAAAAAQGAGAAVPAVRDVGAVLVVLLEALERDPGPVRVRHVPLVLAAGELARPGRL